VKLDLMPIRPVKNGYELLDNACEAILAEPKRLKRWRSPNDPRRI
jgi:hypothetical protein